MRTRLRPWRRARRASCRRASRRRRAFARGLPRFEHQLARTVHRVERKLLGERLVDARIAPHRAEPLSWGDVSGTRSRQRPVASMRLSSTTKADPSASNSSQTSATSEASASSGAQTVVVPAPTSSGVLGMTRTKRAPEGRRSANHSVVRPAAMETKKDPPSRRRMRQDRGYP